MDEQTSQEWRGPLRDGDGVRQESRGGGLRSLRARRWSADPEAALRESIRLFIDANPTVAEEDFFARHKDCATSAIASSLLRLFEMQRAAQATLTSCAWFFDDFGGPEGRIVLRWAARARSRLASEFVPSVEPELLDRLRQIHSNRREIGDAATLYLESQDA